MDEVLRRRLVGAGVLLAGAFVLATLLPDAGPRSGRPVEHVVTYDLRTGRPIDLPELAPKPAPQPAPPAPQAVKPAVTPAAAPEAAEPVISTTPTQAKSIELKPAQTRPAQPKPAESKPAQVAAAPPTVSHPVLKVDESFGAKPPAAAKTTGSSGYFVQIGSFESEANAGSVLKKLRNAGMPALIQAVPSGQKLWYRVRVGPYATETAATQVLGTVRTNGYRQSRLVKPEVEPATSKN